MENVRQKGLSIYGGEEATFNAQTYVDVRVLASFYLYLREEGIPVNSMSGIIKHMLYWIHTSFSQDGTMPRVDSVEDAVQLFEGAGFSMRQLKSAKRGHGVVKGLQRESMAKDFGKYDPRAASETLLSDEEMIANAAKRFLVGPGGISADEQTQIERDALKDIPLGISIEQE